MTEYPAFALPAATLKALKADPTDPVALAEAQRVLGPDYISELFALTQVPQAVLLYLEKWGPIVAKAVADGQLPKPQTGPWSLIGAAGRGRISWSRSSGCPQGVVNPTEADPSPPSAGSC